MEYGAKRAQFLKLLPEIRELINKGLPARQVYFKLKKEGKFDGSSYYFYALIAETGNENLSKRKGKKNKVK